MNLLKKEKVSVTGDQNTIKAAIKAGFIGKSNLEA